MQSVFLYQQIKQEFLRYRELALTQQLSPDEAGIALDMLQAELREQHDPELVNEAFDLFESDLRFLSFAEWVDNKLWLAHVIGLFIPLFVKQETFVRAEQLSNDLLELDAKYA